MDWETEEFGAAHQGRAGAVLADGSEPKPVYLDTGSGGSMHASTNWWLYDGTFGTPKATHLRGICSCGWRGTHLIPVNWTLAADGPETTDTSAVHDDWVHHIADVQQQTVPLPTGLPDLLEQLDAKLTGLAVEAPLAALRALSVLERTVARTGHTAITCTQADGTSDEQLARALGVTEKDAEKIVSRYLFTRR
ncbi:hypothetical protein [Streptomyces orinoci]|uniref:Uncharacterized protein n=1 Tax=Streptomyces orinoci TaxID=67339 RepID=A0ABV3K105_STRON|nr:hypothetical protein [Streptomyces orinoci]